MRKVLVLLIIIFSVGISLFVIANLKGEEQTIQAYYLMLACEGCYHMEVEKSTDPAIISKTIIPRSDKVGIEQLINDALESNKKSFCLKGRARLFNLNLFNIDPDGIVFFVEEALPLTQCEEI